TTLIGMEQAKCHNILWTDESKFVLFGSKGHRQFVRCPANTEFKPQYTVKMVKHCGASVLLRGCFSYYGVGPIYCIPGIMDQFEYIRKLEEGDAGQGTGGTKCGTVAGWQVWDTHPSIHPLNSAYPGVGSRG
uniref:Uncharacterized protein n=1 Tax=Kryptolebias marmoratus TaxID=37003 RepID=A0A3Q2ZFF9_KRYMA